MGNPFSTSPIEGGGSGGGAGVSGLDTADGGTALANNAIVRGDGTTGIQGSGVTLDDNNAMWVNTFFRVNVSGTAPGTSNASNPMVSIGHSGVTGIGLASGRQIQFSTSNNSENTLQQGIAYGGTAGTIRITDGSSGAGALLTKVLVEANTAGSGAPNVLTATESRTALTNEGATAANYHTLPTAVAGLQFEFVVQDADGMRIVANTGDTIRVIDKVTATAGYIESTTIGSVVRLLAINATEWYATSIHGVWTDSVFTFSDVGNTSP